VFLVASNPAANTYVASVTPDLSGTLSAVEIVQKGVLAGGGKGGGGRPDMAQGGGPGGQEAADLAVKAARALVEELTVSA
jgi:alanyl-tRNA synthetase